MTTPFIDASIGLRPLINEGSRLERLRQKVSAEGWPTDEQETWITLTAMAASIEKCYSGAERIIKDLVQELDGSVPSGGDWHQRLINFRGKPRPSGRGRIAAHG